MTAPRKLSRRAFEAFDGERWNAYVDFLAMSDPEGLTPRQRVAYLAFWYSSEILNGGHDQYFGNKEHFDHDAVVAALVTLGAECQADVLRRAWSFEQRSEGLKPDSSDLDRWLKDYEVYGSTGSLSLPATWRRATPPTDSSSARRPHLPRAQPPAPVAVYR